jgi:hypothetical protein
MQKLGLCKADKTVKVKAVAGSPRATGLSGKSNDPESDSPNWKHHYQGIPIAGQH